MAERVGVLRAGLALLTVLALVAGCASKKEKAHDEDLSDLIAWFPGHYDDLAQVQKDEKTGVMPPHEQIALLVRQAQTPRLGHHVFFVQEMAPDNPERIMSQRMFSFDIDEDRGVVGLVYSFVEPVRWREAAKNPQLLASVMTEDVSPIGCELIWKRSGDKLVAGHDPRHCRAGGAQPSGPEASLSPDSLMLAGYEFRKR
ncbi:MAG: hypothetical protein JSS29_13810 [Proteobacteria bacterium]|nr:hypothetical protein [Pseudomonadota bacterium]